MDEVRHAERTEVHPHARGLTLLEEMATVDSLGSSPRAGPDVLVDPGGGGIPPPATGVGQRLVGAPKSPARTPSHPVSLSLGFGFADRIIPTQTGGVKIGQYHG